MGVDPLDDARVHALFENYLQHRQRITKAIADDLQPSSATVPDAVPNTIDMVRIVAFAFGVVFVVIVLFIAAKFGLRRTSSDVAPTATFLRDFGLHSMGLA